MSPHAHKVNTFSGGDPFSTKDFRLSHHRTVDLLNKVNTRNYCY